MSIISTDATDEIQESKDISFENCKNSKILFLPFYRTWYITKIEFLWFNHNVQRSITYWKKRSFSIFKESLLKREDFDLQNDDASSYEKNFLIDDFFVLSTLFYFFNERIGDKKFKSISFIMTSNRARSSHSWTWKKKKPNDISSSSFDSLRTTISLSQFHRLFKKTEYPKKPKSERINDKNWLLFRLTQSITFSFVLSITHHFWT